MSANLSRRHMVEKLFAGLTRVALFTCAAILLFLLGSIFVQGAKAISWEFLTSPAQDFGRSGGIVYQIAGSLLLVVTAAALVLPIAVGTAIYRSCYMRSARAQRAIDQILFALNAIPSITYGIFGLVFFVNVLGTGITWYVGAIILAIMMLPTVTLASKQAMLTVPKIYRENATALGLTKASVIRRVVLPQSLHGVITGLLLALARAIGETAPIMFIATAFSGVKLPSSFSEPVSTLPTHILALAQQSVDPQALRNAWGASLTLVAMVALFSLAAFFIRSRLTPESRPT